MGQPGMSTRRALVAFTAAAAVTLPLASGFVVPATTMVPRTRPRQASQSEDGKLDTDEQVSIEFDLPRASSPPNVPAKLDDVALGMGANVNPNPTLLTFDAVGTLIREAEAIGMHYRSVLFQNSFLRLPRPDIFTAAHRAVYKAKSEDMPCFGCGASVSTADWWADVVRETYLKVGVPEEILNELFPVLFDELYNNIFVGPDGWELTEYTMDVLEKLRKWKEEEGGPRLGIIANFDERLPEVLEALGVAQYFDFCITSRECGMEKPSRQIFDIAMGRMGLRDRTSAVHLGNSYENDVVGATSAGWHALYLADPPYHTLPDQTLETPYTLVSDMGRLLDVFGRGDDDLILHTTDHRGIHDVGTFYHDDPANDVDFSV